MKLAAVGRRRAAVPGPLLAFRMLHVPANPRGITRTIFGLCLAWLMHEGTAASLRHGHSPKGSTAAVEALTAAVKADVVNTTAEVEGAISAILSGRSLQGEYSRLPLTGREEAEVNGAAFAAERLGLAHVGLDLADVAAAWAAGRAKEGSRFDEATIRRAVQALASIMGQVWQQLDDRVVACSAMREKSAKWRDQLDLDLVGASDELARIVGLRTQGVTGIQNAEETLDKLNAGWQEEVHSFEKTVVRIARARELQKDDLAKLEQTVKLTKCSSASAASFLEASPSQGFRVCRSNATFFVQTGDSKVLKGAFETPRAQKVLASLLDTSVDEKNSSLKEAVPHELQHLKCSFGRLDCGAVHLSAMRLLAETTDALEELDQVEDRARKDHQKYRKDIVSAQEVLRTQKMELEQQLAEAVSRMASVNQVRRSLAEEVRTQIRESRQSQEQCKTAVRVSFETMCGLRKVRSYLVTKSSQIELDHIVDCDVTDWQPGECSLSCDDTCPGPTPSVSNPNPRPCGGAAQLTREVIQEAGSLGMACPALSRVTACNAVKCPVDCKVSSWSNWTSCSRECGGGVSSRIRSILQLPQNGGEACGPPTESKPCNTGACGFCALRPWSKWSQCSAICSGGVQVRTKDPVDASEDPSSGVASSASPLSGEKDLPCPTCSLTSSASLLETSKAKCPDASSPHRYEERSCMTQKCLGDERCVEDQDLLLAIDGSSSLSAAGFEALRTFAARLVEKYQSPTTVGILQFGNGDLLSDGTVSEAKKVADLTTDLSSTVQSLSGLSLLSGFPNMAQGLSLAESMFKKARSGAAKTLLVMTNSKPLYKHKALEQAARLRRQGVRIFVVSASDSLQSGPFWEKADDFMVKELASRPIDANFFHIDALTGPKADPLSQVPAVVARVCRKGARP